MNRRNSKNYPTVRPGPRTRSQRLAERRTTVDGNVVENVTGNQSGRHPSMNLPDHVLMPPPPAPGAAYGSMQMFSQPPSPPLVGTSGFFHAQSEETSGICQAEASGFPQAQAEITGSFQAETSSFFQTSSTGTSGPLHMRLTRSFQVEPLFPDQVGTSVSSLVVPPGFFQAQLGTLDPLYVPQTGPLQLEPSSSSNQAGRSVSSLMRAAGSLPVGPSAFFHASPGTSSPLRMRLTRSFQIAPPSSDQVGSSVSSQIEPIVSVPVGPSGAFQFQSEGSGPLNLRPTASYRVEPSPLFQVGRSVSPRMKPRGFLPLGPSGTFYAQPGTSGPLQIRPSGSFQAVTSSSVQVKRQASVKMKQRGPLTSVSSSTPSAETLQPCQWSVKETGYKHSKAMQDMKTHEEGCPLVEWAQHEKSLCTDEEIRNELLQYFMKKRSWNNPRALAMANKKCEEALSSNGYIVQYLKSQRQMFEDLRQADLRQNKCMCGEAQPAAALDEQNGVDKEMHKQVGIEPVNVEQDDNAQPNICQVSTQNELESETRHKNDKGQGTVVKMASDGSFVEEEKGEKAAKDAMKKQVDDGDDDTNEEAGENFAEKAAEGNSEECEEQKSEDDVVQEEAKDIAVSGNEENNSLGGKAEGNPMVGFAEQISMGGNIDEIAGGLNAEGTFMGKNDLENKGGKEEGNPMMRDREGTVMGRNVEEESFVGEKAKEITVGLNAVATSGNAKETATGKNSEENIVGENVGEFSVGRNVEETFVGEGEDTAIGGNGKVENENELLESAGDVLHMDQSVAAGKRANVADGQQSI